MIDAIKRMHPGEPLHGLHGSDLGGMWVRGIYDESGWIYPFPVRRRDGVSATAIRAGVKGMTASAVTQVLSAFGPDEKWVDIRGRRYSVKNGLVVLQS